MYSELVMKHFADPQNVGVIEDADGVGKVGNPMCGDVMEMFIKVKDDRVEDVKFRTFGCGAAIATSSIATEMIKGKSLDEAVKLSNKAVADALGGLPAQKMHCSNLAADAVRAAIEDYWSRRRGGERRSRAARGLAGRFWATLLAGVHSRGGPRGCGK
jgi:nitrogen fixation NifU-like protein